MGEQRNVSSNSDQEIDNRTNSHKNVSLITNQEIHELLEEEVKKIKENKTKSVAGKRKVPPEDTKNNKGREINSNEKEYVKKKYPESYAKEIKFEGSLKRNMNGIFIQNSGIPMSILILRKILELGLEKYTL